MDSSADTSSDTPSRTRTPGPASERVRVRRRAKRGSYDRASADEIFDQALLCRIGFVDDGQPYVFPTTHLRRGDFVYVHGNRRNRMLGRVASGEPVAVEATLVDGLIMGRSVFGHGMNYRSAVVLGRGREVLDVAEKTDLMNGLVERILPGRIEGLRQLTEAEIRSTTLVAIPMDEFSVKTRGGPPDDLEADRGWPVWAGTLPLHTATGTPDADPFVPDDMPAPEYLHTWAQERRSV